MRWCQLVHYPSVKNCVASLNNQGKECDIAVIGDKGRGQLRRVHGDKITMSMTELGAPGNFTLAGSIASDLIANGAADYDAIVIMYNAFKNAACTIKCTRLSNHSAERVKMNLSLRMNSNRTLNRRCWLTCRNTF